MNNSFAFELFALFLGIVLIILLTTKWKLHAFFALIIACFVIGIMVQMPLANLIKTVEEGFGNIMKSLGLIIILGSTLGFLLEHTGSTKAMAQFILKKVGKKNTSLALSLTGFVVGMPVFCDSGYIVLNGLNKSLASSTGKSIAILSSSLATGLYAVHCMIPPHPGATAAATTIGVDFGSLILYGILVAVPAMIMGNLWTNYAGKKIAVQKVETEIDKEEIQKIPATYRAFLPVIIPILLMGTATFLKQHVTENMGWEKNLLSLGDPVIALAIGILLALSIKPKWQNKELTHLLQEAVEKAGGILVIIGAGGSFGAVIAATKFGNHFGDLFLLEKMGIFFPFIVTALLKTAQGSSTVAIITASSIVLPLLPSLGLESDHGKLLAVLSMGAGSMVVSHANDAYFWVISKFSGVDMKTMLRVYSVSTLFMGLVSLLMVYFLSLIIL